MFKTLALKEIRQTSIVLVLGMAASVIAACFYAHTISTQIALPFIRPEPVPIFALAVMPVAVALGLVQSLEFAKRSSLFLLHLPLERRQLIQTKLVVGLTALVIISALPVLAMTVAYSMPRAYPAPFRWTMTGDVWRLILSSTIVYLAAFLCGIRPARWFGTRTLPLLGMLLVAFFIQAIPYYWWLIGPLLVVGTCWTLATTIFDIADNRDYS